MSHLRISEVRFVPARADQIKQGLAGYISLVLGDAVKLDGIALRRTSEGKATLSFPCRTDRGGRDHPFIRPLSDRARIEFERQVFEALGVPR